MNLFIIHLCVAPEYRGKGIANQLMQEVEKRIKSLGTKHEPYYWLKRIMKMQLSFMRSMAG
jgi:ribosomal protein S18 acetylase RimI-like enzyme